MRAFLVRRRKVRESPWSSWNSVRFGVPLCSRVPTPPPRARVSRLAAAGSIHTPGRAVLALHGSRGDATRTNNIVVVVTSGTIECKNNRNPSSKHRTKNQSRDGSLGLTISGTKTYRSTADMYTFTRYVSPIIPQLFSFCTNQTRELSNSSF